MEDGNISGYSFPFVNNQPDLRYKLLLQYYDG